MEFKFGGGDDHRRTPYFEPPPSSSFGNYYDQETRGGNREMMLWREMEKDRIREEVIAEEIARRRLLEEELRREMEVRLVRGGGEEERERLSVAALASYFSDYRWLEDRLAFYRHRRRMMVSQPPEAPPPPVARDNNYGSTMPVPNLCGTKRKSAAPSAGDAGELPLSCPQKKPKWGCALCHVTSGCEVDLRVHLQGRKHKAREAEVRSQKMGKSLNAAPFPKKTGKKTKGGLLQANESDGSSEKKWKKFEKKNDHMSVEQNGKKHHDQLGRTSRKGEATKDCKTMAEEGKKRRGKDLEVEAEEINEEEGGSPEVIVADETKMEKPKLLVGMFELRKKVKDSDCIAEED